MAVCILLTRVHLGRRDSGSVGNKNRIVSETPVPPSRECNFSRPPAEKNLLVTAGNHHRDRAHELCASMRVTNIRQLFEQKLPVAFIVGYPTRPPSGKDPGRTAHDFHGPPPTIPNTNPTPH